MRATRMLIFLVFGETLASVVVVVIPNTSDEGREEISWPKIAMLADSPSASVSTMAVIKSLM